MSKSTVTKPEDRYAEENLDKRWRTDHMPDHPMMKCGHTAQGYTIVDGVKMPVCAICVGIIEGAMTPVEAPNLEGRYASCTYCHQKARSHINLPFFEHKPNRDEDRYYCGCWGWD